MFSSGSTAGHPVQHDNVHCVRASREEEVDGFTPIVHPGSAFLKLRHCSAASFLRVLSPSSADAPVLVSIIKISPYSICFTRTFPSVALRDKDRSRILLYDTWGKKARASQGGQVLLGSDTASQACWWTGGRRGLRARSRELTHPSRGSHKSLPEKSVRKFNSFAGQVSDWSVTAPNKNKLAARDYYPSQMKKSHSAYSWRMSFSQL